MHTLLLARSLRLMPFLNVTDPGGGGGSDDLPADTDQKQKVEFTDEQNTEIGKIVAREVRKAADKARSDRDAEIAAEKTAADVEAKRKADEEAGKYEEAKTQLTSERDEAVSKRDKALGLLKANVDANWDGLPESVKSTYQGDAEDVLAKSEYMQQMKPVIDQLREAEAKGEERSNPGNPPGKTPSDKKTTTDEDEEARRRMRPRL